MQAIPFTVPMLDSMRQASREWANWFRAVKALLDLVNVGTGSPENVVAAPIGALYLRQDGSTSTTLYVKTADSGAATGWTAK